MPSEAMKGQFLRFFIVGIAATLIHMAVYLLLNYSFSVSEATPLALTVTYCVGYLVSFLVNYIVSLKWTFKTDGSVGKGVGFAFSHAVNAGLQILLLNVFRFVGMGKWMAWVMVTLLPWLTELFPILEQPESLLPLPVYCVVVPTNFLMVRFFLTREESV